MAVNHYLETRFPSEVIALDEDELILIAALIDRKGEAQKAIQDEIQESLPKGKSGKLKRKQPSNRPQVATMADINNLYNQQRR